MHQPKRLVLPVSIVMVALLILGAYWQRNRIFDWWRLHDYKPPTQIVSLANQDTMTPEARHFFYVYHPQLDNSESFNKNCKVTEKAIVLGCTVIGRGIYIYNISNSQLNGVEQVTAAHEMLHVAYSRLSSSERNYIDSLVMATYNKLKSSDPLLKEEEQSYYQTEGSSAVLNELHSVLGTEVSNLPPALNDYYKQYFTNRQAIVNYAKSYEDIFLQRQKAVAALDQQLSSLRQQISSNENNLTTAKQSLSQQQTNLTSLQNSGQLATYNSDVINYNNQVNSYNSLLQTTQQLITQYNQTVARRNSLAIQENKLVQSISSLPSSSISTAS